MAFTGWFVSNERIVGSFDRLAMELFPGENEPADPASSTCHNLQQPAVGTENVNNSVIVAGELACCAGWNRTISKNNGTK